MTPDLFSSLSETSTPSENYVTRKFRQWLSGDPKLDERCREIAHLCASIIPLRSNNMPSDLAIHARIHLLGERLRELVATEGKDDEPLGLFTDLIDNDLGEVQWSELASSYLESITLP